MYTSPTTCISSNVTDYFTSPSLCSQFFLLSKRLSSCFPTSQHLFFKIHLKHHPSSVGKESACNAGDLRSISGSGRSPGEGNGNPLQYSCLENPIGRGAWQATVRGIAVRHHTLTRTLTHTPRHQGYLRCQASLGATHLSGKPSQSR